MPKAIIQKPSPFELAGLKNNDPLAHVDLFMGDIDRDIANRRTYIEYVTDMGERLVEQPFKKTFEYNVVGDNLISDTGVYLDAFLENGYLAAVNDVRAGNFEASHAKRAKAFYEQLPQIRQWYADLNDNTHKMYLSLCAPDSELSAQEAKKQGFKQDRLMASVQLYEKTDNGIRLHAFSLDGLSFERLSALYDVLDIADEPAKNTVDQLTRPLNIDAAMSAQEAVESVIYQYDKLLSSEDGVQHHQGVDMRKFKGEANAHVESQPEAYDLYRQTVIEVAHSLSAGKVSTRLGAIVEELQFSLVAQQMAVPVELRLEKGQYLNREIAGGVVDYLRNRAIPHYLMSQLQGKTGVLAESRVARYQGVSDAGAQAVASNISYEGSCPTSGTRQTAQSELIELRYVFAGVNGLNPETWTWTTGKCVVDNCPTKPGKTTVGPCSVCVGCQSIFDKGKDPKYVHKNKNKSIIEIFSELLSELFSIDEPDSAA